MLTIKPAVTTIDGVDYQMELATIDHTRLGREGHGIFTFILDLNYGGSGQGAGNYSLNDQEVFGTAVQGLLDFFGGNWEDIAKQKVFALKESRNDTVKGLVSPDQKKWIMFSDWRVRRG